MRARSSFVLVLAWLVPSTLGAQGAPADVAEAELAREIERIRAATEQFHDVQTAVAAGYPSTEHCVESPAGGMGYHLIHPELLDDRLELERPEILVYAPTATGGRRLVGVEYAVPYAAWDRQEPPRILGQDLKPADDLGLWYLHVWVWEENPRGLFADWNPSVRCSP